MLYLLLLLLWNYDNRNLYVVVMFDVLMFVNLKLIFIKFLKEGEFFYDSSLNFVYL